MEYVLQDLEECDRDGVIAVFNYHVEHGFAAYPELPVNSEFFDRILAMRAGYPAVCVRTGSGECVGFGFLRPFHPAGTFRRTAEIAYFLMPEHTSKGLGQRMLAMFEERGPQCGVDNLLASVSSLNEQSLQFHARAGFERCGIFRAVGRKQGRDFDMIWFQKRLCRA